MKGKPVKIGARPKAPAAPQRVPRPRAEPTADSADDTPAARAWRLQRFVGNQATVVLLSALAEHRREAAGGAHAVARAVLQRTVDEDAPAVAKALSGDEKNTAQALKILRTAEAMHFYEPVKRLALTGRVLNPDGLETLVTEFYALARQKEGATATHGLVRELLHALTRAEDGDYVQLGAWRPDHLQRGMKALAEEFPQLGSYLKELEERELALQVGWGGDVTTWKIAKSKLGAETVQHKVLEADTGVAFENELIKAASQLAGQNTELALPGSVRVADIVVLSAKSPISQMDSKELTDLVERILTSNTFRRRPLTDCVDEVRVGTRGRRVIIVIEDGHASVRDESKGTEVADVEEATPKMPAETLKGEAAVLGEERDAYERHVRARAAKTRFSGEPDKGLADAVDFLRNGSKRLAVSKQKEPERSEELEAAYKIEFVKAKRVVADDKVKSQQRKEAAEAEWARENPEAAQAIVAYDRKLLAATLLKERRTKTPKWVEFAKLRDSRANFIRQRVAARSDSGADKRVIFDQVVAEWNAKDEKNTRRFYELEAEMPPKIWVGKDDDPELALAIQAAAAAADAGVLDIEGVDESVGRGRQKQERQKARQERGALERARHATLAKALLGHIKQEEIDATFEQVGAVKESEGNARAVAAIVDQLAASLLLAWHIADDTKRIDGSLLGKTTLALTSMGSGVGYLGMRAEINELVRRAEEVDSGSPLRSGKWYAFEQGGHSTWAEADEQAAKDEDGSKGQEVDVSYMAGEIIHASEVAADIYVLRDKLLSAKKAKQREDYVKLQRTRKARVTYAVDSDADWEKIYEFGATPKKQGLQAPMVRWLLDHDMALVVRGTPRDLVECWAEISKRHVLTEEHHGSPEKGGD